MSATHTTAADTTALRAFEIGFDESQLTELRRRIEATIATRLLIRPACTDVGR